MHRDEINHITERIIAAALTVHRALGPGLLESAYQTCLAVELEDQALFVEREVPLALNYKSKHVHCAYRMDFVVEKQVVLEIKAVESLGDIHVAQMITYLRMSGYSLGLIFNFNVNVLSEGIRRVILGAAQRIQRSLR